MSNPIKNKQWKIVKDFSFILDNKIRQVKRGKLFELKENTYRINFKDEHGKFSISDSTLADLIINNADYFKEVGVKEKGKLIGHLNKDFLYIGFKPIRIGSEVFELHDRYYFEMSYMR